MNPRLPSLCCSLLLLFLPACGGAVEDFAGNFQGQNLRVELQAKGEGFAGRIILAGQEYPATAERSAAGLSGRFGAGGREFTFTASHEGGALRLVSGGSSYLLKPEVAQNPLAKQETPVGNPLVREPKTLARPAKAAPRAAVAGKLFSHPSGVRFHHPEEWRLKAVSEEVLFLMPPDLHQVGGQPAEALLVFGDDAGEIRDIQAPAVRQQVTAMVAQMFPFMSLQGRPKQETVAGAKALVMGFAGKNQGKELRAEMRLRLVEGKALGTLALSDPDRFASRQQAMARIFASMDFAKPKVSRPAGLVGSWRYTNTYISGTFSSVTIRNMVLKADGTCLEGGRMMAGMTHHDNGGHQTGSSHADSGKGVEHRGRWRTRGKKIILDWAGGGSETWDYYIEGKSMLWSQGGTKKLWKRT